MHTLKIKKYLFSAFSFVLIFTLFGCASKSHKYITLVPISTNIETYKQILVKAMHPNTDPSQYAERIRLSNEIKRKLEENGNFFQIREESANGVDWGDLYIEFSIVKIDRVSTSDRLLLGAMAGQASLHLHVSLIDKKNDKVIGKANVIGKSSTGNIFSGTTAEAIDEAAVGVVNFVKKSI